MKSVYLFLAMLVSFASLAQDPQLFENDWYLQKVTINNVDYLPTLSGELYFAADGFTVGHPYCKDSYYTPISYEGANVFNLEDNPLNLIGICANPLYIDFMNLHYSVFFNTSFAKNPFSYIIESGSGASKTLRITNNEGAEAIYGNNELAIQDQEKLVVSIYPNPVQDILRIKINDLAGVLDVKFYDLEGRLTLTKDINTTSNTINVENLESGVYFILLENNLGKIESIKFIKK